MLLMWMQIERRLRSKHGVMKNGPVRLPLVVCTCTRRRACWGSAVWATCRMFTVHGCVYLLAGLP